MASFTGLAPQLEWLKWLLTQWVSFFPPGISFFRTSLVTWPLILTESIPDFLTRQLKAKWYTRGNCATDEGISLETASITSTTSSPCSVRIVMCNTLKIDMGPRILI